jgi:hydroxypyruvate reductase 2
MSGDPGKVDELASEGNAMKPDILVVGAPTTHVAEAIEAGYTPHHLARARDKDAFLREVGPRIRGIATSAFFGVPAGVLEACPKLEIIASFGVGTDTLRVKEARARGIIVTNTPDVLNDDVANMAVALLLASTRDIARNDRYVRDGRWKAEGDPPLSLGIAGKQIGILGLGRIGADIARKLEAFGCRIAYHSRNRHPTAAYPYYASLVDLAKDSAALIAIVPGGAETAKMVDARVLEALGPEGVFVNVARGSVVDEHALVEALRSGKLGRAALDVFADEPNVPEALLAMENVVLQPHQASATVETRRAMGELVLENLAAHFAGRKPPTPLP